MAYTAYKTWTVGEVLTANNMNLQVRDNGLVIHALLDLTTASFTDGGPLLGSGAAAITALGRPTAGQIMVGNAAGDPDLVTAMDASDRLLHEFGGMEGDVSDGDGFVEIKGGSTTVIKTNLAASDAPDANDDTTADYAVGSLWLDTTADTAYICVDASATAAVWLDLSASTIQSTIISGTRTAAAGSGDQALTGVGFQPAAVIVLCTSQGDPVHEGSWGLGDDALGEALMFVRIAPMRTSAGGQIINVSSDGSNGMAAVLKTLDADGLTFTWTKSGTPTGTAEFQILCLR